ncbi:MAG: CsgG/HfaB family protein [Rickettsiales bacterium]
MLIRKYIFIILSVCALSACTQRDMYENSFVTDSEINARTRAGDVLANLPLPVSPVPVVVYDFVDQTGQFRDNGRYTDYSSAVTKGGYSILVNALLNAGKNKWFTVAERGSLKNLLQERQIIELTRNKYRSAGGKRLPKLPPLIYGGMMIEGGIVSYDSNIISGGIGAVYLGIGGSVQYRRDLVTVYLRAISIQSGKVLLSVNSSKTIYSVAADANFLRYFAVSDLFQSEAGFAMNEPTQLGVRQAIETALYSLIMEGAINEIWQFRNVADGRKALKQYMDKKDHAHSPSASGSEQSSAPKVTQVDYKSLAIEEKYLPKEIEYKKLEFKEDGKLRKEAKYNFNLPDDGNN